MQLSAAQSTPFRGHIIVRSIECYGYPADRFNFVDGGHGGAVSSVGRKPSTITTYFSRFTSAKPPRQLARTTLVAAVSVTA